MHSSRPIHVGVIGTGKHGTRYANHLFSDCSGFHLQAISRRSPEGKVQAQRWGCQCYSHWQDLIADPQVEAVISVVPPTLNLAIAEQCAALQKPLLLEKPLAGSAEQAAQIVSLTKTEGLVLTTGQTLRYNAVIQSLRTQLAVIGRLRTFSANQRLEPSSLKWHHQPEIAGAGISFHTAVHVFDALRYITGLEVQRVMAVTRQLCNTQLEDVLLVLAEMENGVVGTVDCSKVSRARSGLFEFVGADGILQGEQIYNRCQKIRGTEVIDLSPEGPVNTILPLLLDWEQYLRGMAQNPVPGKDGYASVRLCQACLQSAEEGRWIHL